MRTKILYVVALLATLFALSFLTNCTKGVTDSKDKLLPLEGKIMFNLGLSSVMAIPPPGANWFALNIQTEKIYSCSNWRILSTLQWQPSQLPFPTSFVVSIQGIQPQDVCLRAVGSATQIIDPLLISTSGAVLQFKYKGFVDTYEVSLVDFQPVVKPIHARFTVYQPLN